MLQKNKIRIIIGSLITVIFIQLAFSTWLLLETREALSPEVYIFIFISIGTSAVLIILLHYVYFMLIKVKNGIIGRLDDALMTSLRENEKLEEKTSDLEIQLRHTQKLETIGTLAGGMAHDFNNLLSPILGYSDLALSRLSRDDTLFLYINEIVRAAAKAKSQVEQVLNFSRQIDSEGKNASLRDIIEETVTIIRPMIPSTVDIKLQLCEETCYVKADPEGVNQILVNLCTNAWQAMSEEGGTLTVTSELLEDSAFALLTVRDTGTGIDEETRKHMFEPFYSTRSDRSSSGLGLSVVQGIVTSVGGRIRVDTTPGYGSLFSVYLPLRESRSPCGNCGSESGKDGHILLVDDDENITAMICNMLADFGFSIELFNNSRDALQAFREQPWKFNLVITDLTMPNLTGSEMKKEMKKIRDDIPVLIMTGYGSGESEQQAILKKPFIKTELLSAIEHLLD